MQGRTRRLVIRRRSAFSNQLIKCRQSYFLLLFKGSAAVLLCPRATFARDSALSALHPLFKGLAAALLSPWRYSSFCSFLQANGRAHGRAPACFRIPRCETGCEACSHKSAKSAENIELPYLWLRNDGGTEPDRGHSVSFSWSAYPSRGEGSAGHFSEVCPANGINPRAKLRYSSIKTSLIELAEPS